MGQLTLSEAISTGLKTTVLGMLIIFSALVILMIAIFIMKKIFYKEPEKAVSVQTPTVATPAEPEEDTEELIAVLTAAVAASLNTSTYNLKIKSFRRTDNNFSALNGKQF